MVPIASGTFPGTGVCNSGGAITCTATIARQDAVAYQNRSRTTTVMNMNTIVSAPRLAPTSPWSATTINRMMLAGAMMLDSVISVSLIAGRTPHHIANVTAMRIGVTTPRRITSSPIAQGAVGLGGAMSA